MLTYKQKHEQANREALATVVALVITIVVWAVCGFGLSGFDVQVFHTPLWVVGGTLGTWLCAIIVSVVLAKRFFVGFDLDDEEALEGAAGTEGNAAARVAATAATAAVPSIEPATAVGTPGARPASNGKEVDDD